ncbi:hypothetical protein GQ457_08G036710 [Hibiscus cannabinus]
MLEHLYLKFKTGSEALHQQETLNSLPKANRSSISNYLFYSVIENVYLFQGVSKDFLFPLLHPKEVSSAFLSCCIMVQILIAKVVICVNSEGIVPLWEAMPGAHHKVAKLLNENGTNINVGDVCHRLRAYDRGCCHLSCPMSH